MKAENFLSSLCYFSVFFAPFLFPLIVFIFASGEMKHHAGKSLWIHLVPYLSMFMALGAGAWAWKVGNQTIAFTIMIIFVIVGIYYVILNLVKGIKVLFAI